MTHDELLAKIDEEISAAEFEERCGDGGWSAGAKALRAVVELHKPKHFIGNNEIYCNCSISPLIVYPCPTIQIIEKELK